MTPIHSTFLSLTGYPEPWKLGHTDYVWGIWQMQGWTEQDLKLVVAYLRRTVKSPSILARMLTFRYLIWNTENFRENLHIAKAMNRCTPKQSERDRLIQHHGKPEPVREAISAAVALERTKLSAMLKQWREGL